MKAIVTGGLGFIGSHVVDQLIENHHDVYVIDNLLTGSLNNKNPAAHYEIHDILNRNFLKKFFQDIQPNWIFHLAALPRIQPSFSDPEEHDRGNVHTSFSLIDAAKGIKSIKAIVNSSSSAVYGNPSELPTTESAFINPLSPYALQKYTAERYLHILAQWHHLPVVSLRYFNVYGPRSFNKKNPYNAYSSVIGIFRHQKSNQSTLTITGDGSQERDFVHVTDCAKANICVAEQIYNSIYHVYNVGYGEKISILDLAKLFKHPYTFIPERKGEAYVTWASIKKIQKMGWFPTIDLNTAISKGNI